MSKQTGILELNKCISSRLWYTSLNVFQLNDNNSFLKEFHRNCCVDLAELEAVVESLIYSPNEEQYQWIAYVLLWKLIDNKSSPVNCNIQRNIQSQFDYIQMRNVIKLCNDVPDNLYKELILFLQDTSIENGTRAILTFLRKNINIKPRIVCWVISRLISTTNAIATDLQDIYFSAIKSCLEHIPLKKHWYLSHEAYTSGVPENSLATECALRSDALQNVLCLLSKMNFDTDTEIEFLNLFYPMFFKVHHVNDIELALYSKKNEKLFNEWLSLWDESHACSESATTLSAAYTISESMFRLENSKVLLCEQEIVKRISKRQSHWLNDILDICYILTVNRRYAEVELLLSCDLLKTLYPVLLFKALNECAREEINYPESCDNGIFVCESFKFLLDKCSSHSLKDDDLSELYLLLADRVRIIEYILYYKRHLIEVRSGPKGSTNLQSDATEQQAASVKGLLSLLQRHGTLFVLKTATNIHNQDHDAIKDLLGSDELDIFRQYCCIVSALRAILLCEFYNAEHERIAGHICDMVSCLSSLPLCSRIETMKNVFSLLFLRYEDFNATSSRDERDTLPGDTDVSKTMECEKSGFIANKYAVRDMLHHLWECVAVAAQETGEDQAALRENLSAFESALTDARWRLSFYMEPSFVKNVGTPQDESDNGSAANRSESAISQNPNFPHRREEDTFFYNGCSTSDEIKIKSESDPESGLPGGGVRRKKRSRTATADSARNRPHFMNLMLASKESLILHCLWKSDLDKAQRVVEMFHMKNTQLDGEVRFSKALRAFKQTIFRYSLDTTDCSKESTNTSILENVRQAAQEGVQSSKHISQLETFLASQESHLRMLSTDVLNGNEILAFSALDLGVTTSRTCQISSNLCDVAMKYLTACKTLDSKEHSSFFSRIYQLFYEIKNTSVTAILCDARIPLSAKEWKESNAVWREFESDYRAFSDLEREETTETRSRGGNYSLGLKTIKKMCGLFSHEQKYLQNVSSHLLLVCTIIPDIKNANINTVSDLLKIPLHRYFGYQIFDLKIEPDKLETIASDLQVNLIHSILVNACPNISCSTERSYSNIKNSGCIILNQNHSESRAKTTAVNPSQYVSEILTELLQVLRDASSGQFCIINTRLKSISVRADVRAVLNKTSSLATLDLSELSVGDETLAFFLNVWNIMFLHASLDVWSDDPPLNDLRHAVSLMSIGYVIGDLGLVTLAALRSKLLGGLANDFKFFTRVEELNELAWQDLDLVQNPRAIFAMANEFYGTPEIRVFETRALNESLNDAMRDYMSHYLPASLDRSVESTNSPATRKRTNLPDLVRRYKNALSQNIDSATSVNEDAFRVDELETSKEDTDAECVTYVFSYAYEVILKYSEYNIFTGKSTSTVETSLWETRVLRPSLVQYLESHCWLLSHLLQRMYNENSAVLDNNYDNVKRTACLENLLSSTWVDKLKPFFNGNQTVAAIRDIVPVRELWRYLQSRGEDHNWQNSLEITNALADNITKCDAELRRFRDLVLSHALSNLGVLSAARMLQYLYQIEDIRVLAQTILYNVNKWPMNVCEHALLHALQHEFSCELPAHCKHRMNGVLCRITIFHKMVPYCVSRSSSTWYDVMYCTEKIEPYEIIKSLINADQFELCLEWLECQAFSLEIQPAVIQDFLLGLLRKEQQDFEQALKFLQALPPSQSVKICKAVLKKLESISALRFIANYLLERCRSSEQSKYQKTLIGLEVLGILEKKDRALYIHLIKEPLLMLEQLLMNCKFENIQKILNTLHKNLEHPDVGIGNFDKIIRFYAKKSLDFRVSLQRDESRARNPSQSTSETENNDFIMPVNVPTKEEWIPNDRAKECSCCKAVIFSMFNRRHHCRRCGRVVCAVCSQHRMQVAGYPSSVHVRVCDDCKRQTVLQMRAAQDAPSASSSEVFDYWRLTRDEKHNRTIREEFSFEHAPNISLCLAILNLHSDHKIYTSFFLDRCDEMKQLLQPVNGGRINPEVDHAVIIKMIRSLLIAVKVKCAKLGFNTGLAHCDRFLSQVDLIATLIQSDCLTLVPTDDLDEHTLRKLRDLLTEKEQWTLALNVSTKAGLDTQGVWAAWGKACLKVGFLDQAREKFHHCLDKIVHEDFDGWVVLSYARESTEKSNTEPTMETTTTKRRKTLDEKKTASEGDGHSKRNEYSKCRPLKDPPLLTEILQILDNLSIHRFRAQHSSQSRSDAAQEILQTLNSLKAVSQNQFNVKYMVPTNQTIYYQESLYYLSTYGSSNSILQFFLKHKEFDKCLAYILENDLECELFLNAVYLHCLRNGDIERLHDAMKTRDPSLLVWRKYLISACHFMEKKQHWHILYQIQLFMRDCVRASMTCIRFYTNEANTYSDLYNKAHLLQDAQKHLESELQLGSLSRKRSTSSAHSGQAVLTLEMEPSEIDRHINTICRQTEIAKFLANCEKESRAAAEVLNLFPDIDNDSSQASRVPTLFGNQQQKVHLAALAILCGRDIGEGFGIAFRIMQDYNLPQQKVYSLAGHVLALKGDLTAIEQLIRCCRSSGAPNTHVVSDHVLTHCVKLLLSRSYSEQNPALRNHIDILIRLITDTELRINAYIESKQLKAAYLLAVKHSRTQDIRRILKESDRLGQNAIKMICLKWLQQELRE